MDSLKETRRSDYDKAVVAFQNFKESVVDSLNNKLGGGISDIYFSSRAVNWSIGLSIIYCTIYLYLMSYFAEYIAWAIIVIVQFGLFIGSAASFYSWKQIHDDEVARKAKFPDHVSDETGNLNLLMTGGIVLGLLGILYLMGICCGYKSLKIAIDVIDASADFLATTKRIILVPVFFFFVTLLILFIWIPSMLALTTMGVTSVKNDPENYQMKQIEFTDDG
jgi:hypothetical protein